jgi:excisionase family DNA binding protein
VSDLATSDPQLLTVPQVAERFQVTAQTIRNWIGHGTLPAIRVGRAFRMRSEDVEALLERASADSASLATRRDVWEPNTTSLPRARASGKARSVWDGEHASLPAGRA